MGYDIPRKFSVTALLNEAHLTSLNVFQAPAGNEHCVFWACASNEASIQAIDFILRALDLMGSYLHSQMRYNAYENKGGIRQTCLLFGPLPLQITSVLGQSSARAVFAHDLSVLDHYDILAALLPGGTLVLNTDCDEEQLVCMLSDGVKRSLAEKYATVLYCNAAATAIESGCTVQEVLAASFFLTLGWSAPPELWLRMNLRQLPVHHGWMQLNVKAKEPRTEAQQTLFEPVIKKDAGRPITPWNECLLRLAFPSEYQTYQRPFADEKSCFQLRVAVNRRLTPKTYERNVFHLELDMTEGDMSYAIGDALGIAGHNDEDQVLEFLSWYGVNPEQLVFLPAMQSEKREGQRVQIRTAFQAFVQSLDIFGRPSRHFYEALAEAATDPQEKSALLYLLSPAGKASFKLRVEETTTYADLLREFPSAKLPLDVLVQLVPSIKMRLYSIASSHNVHPQSIHLLVVTHDWVTPSGIQRRGQCTRYLETLKKGSLVCAALRPSVMKLPPLAKQPIIMAGLGTGMAPFRAFIEERAFQHQQGQQVGDMVLYFGARTRNAEYLYGEELEAYHEGEKPLLTYLRLAFSRDQSQKIYIQHKIQEDSELLADLLLNREAHFYLCGPTWPVPDVRDALVSSFAKHLHATDADAGTLLERVKQEGRYVLEVY